MEVRCGQCNKLFRVSDDKITGAGIKFKCTKCGEDVRITVEKFQEYKLSKDTVSVLDTFAPKPAEKPSTPQPAATEHKAAGAIPGFDLVEEKAAPVPELKVAAAPPPPPPAPPRTAPQHTRPKQEAAAAPPPRMPEPSPAPAAAPSGGPPPAIERPAAPPFVSIPAAAEPSVGGKKIFSVAVAILIFGAAIFGGVWWYGMQKPEEAARAGSEIIMPDGLQVTSSLASWDPATADLILNITIENQTDQEKSAWYLVADVYDAAGGSLAQAMMANGKQLYSKRDYDIMTKRNINIQELRAQLAAQKDLSVPPHGVISVELRVMEPPQGVASFVAVFRPFDPDKLKNDGMEETQQP